MKPVFQRRQQNICLFYRSIRKRYVRYRTEAHPILRICLAGTEEEVAMGILAILGIVLIVIIVIAII
jgi:hypothetical protein